MIEWLFGGFGRKREPVKAFVSSGKDGKWRWEIEDHKGKSLAVSPVQGYSNRYDALAALDRVGAIRIVGKKMGR